MRTIQCLLCTTELPVDSDNLSNIVCPVCGTSYEVVSLKVTGLKVSPDNDDDESISWQDHVEKTQNKHNN